MTDYTAQITFNVHVESEHPPAQWVDGLRHWLGRQFQNLDYNHKLEQLALGEESEVMGLLRSHYKPGTNGEVAEVTDPITVTDAGRRVTVLVDGEVHPTQQLANAIAQFIQWQAL